jgi:hypothetical protein
MVISLAATHSPIESNSGTLTIDCSRYVKDVVRYRRPRAEIDRRILELARSVVDSGRSAGLDVEAIQDLACSISVGGVDALHDL